MSAYRWLQAISHNVSILIHFYNIHITVNTRTAHISSFKQIKIFEMRYQHWKSKRNCAIHHLNYVFSVYNSLIIMRGQRKQFYLYGSYLWHCNLLGDLLKSNPCKIAICNVAHLQMQLMLFDYLQTNCNVIWWTK